MRIYTRKELEAETKENLILIVLILDKLLEQKQVNYAQNVCAPGVFFQPPSEVGGRIG